MNQNHLEWEGLREILETVGEGIIYQEADGRIRYFNQEAQRVFGFGPDEAAGRTSGNHQWRLVHQDGSPCPSEDHPSMITLRTGRALSRQIRGVARPGAPVTWLSINTRPVLQPGQDLPAAVVMSFRDITERRQAEATRLETEQMFRRIFEQSPIGAAIVGLDFRFQRVNQELCRITGYPAEELLGRTFMEITHPDDREFDFEQARRLQSGLIDKHQMDKRYLRKDGSAVWVRLSVQAVRDQQGKIVYYLPMMEDIDKHKRAEEGQRNSEERSRRILQTAMDGFWRTNAQGRILEVNQAYCRMSGYDARELLSKRLSDLDTRLTAEELVGLEQTVAQKGGYRFQSQHRRKDGSLFDVEVSVQPLRSSSGMEFVAFMRDVTDRKRAEEALRQSEERFRDILKNTGAGYFFIDPDGTIRDVNDAWVRMYKYRSADEIIGKDFTVIQQVDDVQKAKEFVAGIMAGDPRYLTGEFSRKCADGSVGFHSFSAIPVVSSGRVTGIEGFILDITARKEAEEKLRASEEFLRRSIDNMLEGFAFQEAIFGDDGRMVDYRFLEFNAAAQKITSVTKDQIIGRTALELFPHLVDRGLMKKYAEVMATGEPAHIIDFYYAGDSLDKAFDITCFRVDSSHFVCMFRDVTEIKLAEQERQESEERNRQIIQTAMDGFWRIDTRGRILEVNQAYCRMSGYSEDELLAMSISDLEAVETPQESAAHLANIIAVGEDRFEARHRRKDGTVFDIEVGIQFKKGKGGGECIAFLRDITERKIAEEAQTANLLRQRLTMDLAKLVHWEYDVDTDLFTFNDQFYAFYGTTAAEQGGYQMRAQEYAKRFLPPEEAHLVGEEIEKLLTTYEDSNYSPQIEHRIIRADGQERFISVRFTLIRDETGRTIKTYGANQDITERKRAERELRENEKRARDIFEQAAVGMSILTPEGKWLQINQRLCEILGYSRDELIKLSYRDITHPDHVEQDSVRIAQIVQGINAGTNWEKRYIRKDGEVIWVRLTTSLARSEDGRPRYFITVTEDITESKMAEEEKAKLETQLRHAQKMEAIGTLAGGIAHDFNNILAAVHGFAEMAYHDAKADKVDPEDLEQIMASVQRAKELVQQILAFSRKQEPDLKPLNLNRLVKKTQVILERTLPKMINIEAVLEEALPPVLADSTQLEQVLLNLASNAQDAMPEGGKLVIATRHVKLSHEDCRRHLEIRPGRYVLLSVSDTGAGMDEGTREHIFEPFFTTKAIGRGTGLGLSSAYGIIKSHGGHIHCTSAVGAGTTFNLYLPVYRQSGTGVDSMPPAAGEASPGGSETILLVDDEEALRKIGSRILQGKGYRVVTAASGEEALRVYAQAGGPPDAAIMDLGMPGMGGLKALRLIMEATPDAKVIIASGYVANTQVKAALESGAAGYVGKPYSKEDLLATVRSVLDKN